MCFSSSQRPGMLAAVAAMLGSLALFSGPVIAQGMAAPTSQVSEKSFKSKVAIGRFSNETRYGKSLLREGEVDPLGAQAGDIMAAYLAQADKFLIFERPDISEIEREQARSGTQNVVGVDTLILGSIVEFGRTDDGQRGLFNKKKVQRARAKVAVRLVDVRTGLVFHSATGEGEATTETKTILGIGSVNKFDGTLSDKAISVAIEDVIEGLVNTLQSRPWRSDILQVRGEQVFIAGGKSQGLMIGDRLAVMREGETIRSDQSGLDITLPAERLGELEVVSLFGESEVNEGAVTRIITGALEQGDPKGVFVTEVR
jgi:curli biogenesis system outer membrane secretion channel CsgG